MSILEEDVQRVRESTDIVAIISERLQLKRVGTRWVGLCPFHSEKSPSFSVNSNEGLYHCFGCKASGDAITFVRETEHVDFVGAVEFLAVKAGIQLRYSDVGESEARKKQKALYTLMERAVDWYAERLISGPEAGGARRYLRERGFDREMVEKYRLGWAPEGWDRMVNALRVDRTEAESAGLGFVNKANRLQDFFRSRILFPIFDDQGRAVAFGGRKLPDAEGPKYQNSRENQLYHKSSTLYGLHWAKTEIVQEGEVLVCEGYTDVIGFHRAGVQRAVATCGTALTEQHLKVLQRFTSRIVLAYDADQAGQAAAERVYSWEKSLGLEVRVVALPPGEDPDSLSQKDPAELRNAVANSRPFLAFRVDRALIDADLSSPETRLRSARRPLEMLAEHPDHSVRSAFLSDIATRVRVDEDVLRDTLDEVVRQPKASGATSGGASAGQRANGDGDPFWGSLRASPPAGAARSGRPRRGRAAPPLPVEVAALALVAEDPSQAGHFDPVMFRHPDSHAVYLALCGAESAAQAAEWLDGSARDLLVESLAGAFLPGDALGAGREAARPAALQLRHELILLVASSELQRLTREAIPADELQRYAEMTSRAANLVQNLRVAVSEGASDPAREAGDALLDWLVEQSENQ